MIRKIKKTLEYSGLLSLMFLWSLPSLWVTLTAFKSNKEIFSIPPTFSPNQPTLEQFWRLFSAWPVGRWLMNSLTLAGIVSVFSLIVCTLAAYSFARLQWPGRDRLFLLILVSMLLPMEVSIIPLYFLTVNWGLFNTIWGAALPLIPLPIGVFLLRQFFINIPRDLEDAAKIDGCSSFGILLRIVLPNSLPVLVAYGIYIFNYAWNEFLWSLIVLRDPQKVTMPVGLRLVQGSFELDYGLINAAAFVASLPALFVFLLLRRRIIRGIALSSGLKG
ncbi:MAG: carbohydrate ABC transporter permease [Candidatus Bathyarchaeia archaeon]